MADLIDIILKTHLSPFQKTLNFENRLQNIWIINNFVWLEQKYRFYKIKQVWSLKKYLKKKNIFEFYSTKLTTYTMSLVGCILTVARCCLLTIKRLFINIFKMFEESWLFIEKFAFELQPEVGTSISIQFDWVTNFLLQKTNSFIVVVFTNYLNDGKMRSQQCISTFSKMFSIFQIQILVDYTYKKILIAYRHAW